MCGSAHTRRAVPLHAEQAHVLTSFPREEVDAVDEAHPVAARAHDQRVCARTVGDLLRGVRFLADSARINSLVMCTRCNWVRFVDSIHFFARERKEEVRLLGF